MIHQTQRTGSGACLSRSSFASLIGSSGQAPVTDRNACENSLLIGTKEAWVGAPLLSDQNCCYLPDASAMIPYEASVQYAHHAVALQHRWLCWHTLAASRCWTEVGTWVSALSFVVFVSALFQQRTVLYASVWACTAAWQLCKHCLGDPALLHVAHQWIGPEQTCSFFLWCGYQIINWPVCPLTTWFGG